MANPNKSAPNIYDGFEFKAYEFAEYPMMIYKAVSAEAKALGAKTQEKIVAGVDELKTHFEDGWTTNHPEGPNAGKPSTVVPLEAEVEPVAVDDSKSKR